MYQNRSSALFGQSNIQDQNRKFSAVTLVLFAYFTVATIFLLFWPLLGDITNFLRSGDWTATTVTSLTGWHATTGHSILDMLLDWLAATVHITCGGCIILVLSLQVVLQDTPAN